MAYSENNIEFVGRFFRTSSGAMQFDWSGSTIMAGFNGTEIAVRLRIAVDNPTSGSCDYLNIYIDDNKPYVLKITEDSEKYLLASGLRTGHHTVKLVKRTEGVFGTLIEFIGFDYADGKAAPAPARKDRRIEIYGDSISAGYGNEGTAPGFRLEEENASLSYGMVAADLLHAECTDIALSGHGVHISLGGADAKVLPDYYNKLLYHSSMSYRFPSEMDPDAVVINLGTNDYAMNVGSADFYQSYLAFAEILHGKYPKAYIVCMIGGGQDRYLDILNQVAKALKLKYPSARIGVFFSGFSIFSAEPADIGADGHPSVSGHRKLGTELAGYINEKLGWN
ncbi:MAG: SGNH/GDSL hydrolase family protein [Saccharofermentanales bacterium]